MTKLFKEEFPLNYFSAEDLRIQWKIMRALGYKSLFDPDFRREIRNPIRKLMYYRLTIADDVDEKKFQQNLAKYVSDRIGFFTDPELYKKVINAEDESRLKTEGVASDELRAKQQELAQHQKLFQSTKEAEDIAIAFLGTN